MITTTTVRVTNGRRRFSRDLSLLGGVALLRPGGLFGTASPGAQEAGAAPSAPAVHTDRKTEGGLGNSMRVSDEIMEYQDEETGARVPAVDRRWFGQRPSILYVRVFSHRPRELARSLPRIVRAGFIFICWTSTPRNWSSVTTGEDLFRGHGLPRSRRAAVLLRRAGVAGLWLDTLEDGELYRVPEGVRPGSSCTADAATLLSRTASRSA